MFFNSFYRRNPPFVRFDPDTSKALFRDVRTSISLSGSFKDEVVVTECETGCVWTEEILDCFLDFVRTLKGSPNSRHDVVGVRLHCFRSVLSALRRSCPIHLGPVIPHVLPLRLPRTDVVGPLITIIKSWELGVQKDPLVCLPLYVFFWMTHSSSLLWLTT